MTWIQQEAPEIATLADRVERLETEPEEPIEERAWVRLGRVELNADEDFCSEQLWALLVQKTSGPAKTMIVGLDNSPRTRGIRAWYKLMRDAKGTHTTQVHEVAERLHSMERKQVQAKDVGLFN